MVPFDSEALLAAVRNESRLVAVTLPSNHGRFRVTQQADYLFQRLATRKRMDVCILQSMRPKGFCFGTRDQYGPGECRRRRIE
jgi:hypothetical protein